MFGHLSFTPMSLLLPGRYKAANGMSVKATGSLLHKARAAQLLPRCSLPEDRSALCNSTNNSPNFPPYLGYRKDWKICLFGLEDAFLAFYETPSKSHLNIRPLFINLKTRSSPIQQSRSRSESKPIRLLFKNSSTTASSKPTETVIRGRRSCPTVVARGSN